MYERTKEWIKRHEDGILLILGAALAFLLRFSLREFESGDYRNFTGPWYQYISEQGGWRALKDVPSNYAPPYLYLLVIASALFSGLPTVFAVKLVAIVFDFVCAAYVYKLVRLKYRTGYLPLFAFLAMLFAPTVFLNSSFWGQADVIYTTGLVACLYYLLTRRDAAALVAFALALSFKLQAAFLAPLLAILLIRGQLAWKKLWLIPAVYALSLLPAWIAGRPLADLLSTYWTQADFYTSLTKNAPNLYQWFPNVHYDILMPAGLIFAVSVAFLFVLLVYKSRAEVTADLVLFLATFSVLFMPYVLPKMHDRYFFPADVISIVFAFYIPRLAALPLIVGGVSFFSYLPFLFGREIIRLDLLALVLLGTILYLARHLARELQLGRI